MQGGLVVRRIAAGGVTGAVDGLDDDRRLPLDLFALELDLGVGPVAREHVLPLPHPHGVLGELIQALRADTDQLAGVHGYIDRRIEDVLVMRQPLDLRRVNYV